MWESAGFPSAAALHKCVTVLDVFPHLWLPGVLSRREGMRQLPGATGRLAPQRGDIVDSLLVHLRVRASDLPSVLGVGLQVEAAVRRWAQHCELGATSLQKIGPLGELKELSQDGPDLPEAPSSVKLQVREGKTTGFRSFIKSLGVRHSTAVTVAARASTRAS